MDIEEEDLVGLEENINHLETILKYSSIVFICGVGGLGKTTLARKVYEDSVIRSRFECFALVEDAPSLRDVWESLMVQLSMENENCGGKVEGMKDEEIAKSVSETMKSKRCLVVLDQVSDLVSLGITWTWQQKHHGLGTRVLITTTTIPNFENQNASVCHLQPLNVQQSWDLLKKRIQRQGSFTTTTIPKIENQRLWSFTTTTIPNSQRTQQPQSETLPPVNCSTYNNHNPKLLRLSTSLSTSQRTTTIPNYSSLYSSVLSNYSSLYSSFLSTSQQSWDLLKKRIQRQGSFTTTIPKIERKRSLTKTTIPNSQRRSTYNNHNPKLLPTTTIPNYFSLYSSVQPQPQPQSQTLPFPVLFRTTTTTIPNSSVCQPLNVQQDSVLDGEIIKLGEKIVARCEGLPLAIDVLSGILLRTRFKVGEWEKICSNLNLRKSKNGAESGLSLLLSLAYEEMSDPLKQCFLHLAHFPENYEIRPKELTHIWIAEGFVKPTESAETQAYDLFKELVEMRVVQVKKRGLVSGRVKTCQVHAAIREFCMSKAKSEGFFHTVDFRTKRQEDPDVVLSPSSPFNRMSIQLKSTSVDTELLPLVQNSHNSLSSFMCFNPCPNPYYSLKLVETLFKHFGMLRVLKFENVTQGYIERIPEEIKMLRLLKYLSLKNTHVRQLPSSIGELSSLQTLSLRTDWTAELPISVSGCLNLRHLYLPDRCTVKGGKYLSFGHLTNLKTLVGVSTKYCDLNDLANLKSLLKLRLQVHDVKHFNESFESSTMVVKFFGWLESLALENSTESIMDLEPLFKSHPQIHKLQIQGRIEKELPRLHSNLVKISLKLTRLEYDPMVELGKLENLRILALDRLSFIGSKMVCSAGSFPRLHHLSVIRLEQLAEWRVEEEALKNLAYLHINYCYNLEKISPSGVTNVENLKQVEIQRMPKHFEKVMFHSQGLKEADIRVTIIEVLD